jgi:hypothetical protein
MARRKAGDVAIFWILMTIIGVVFGIVLIPLVIGLGLLAVAIGGGLGYTVYSLFDSAGWAVLLGLPLFILILSLPLLLIQGVYLVFDASAWTLAYRELMPAQDATP